MASFASNAGCDGCASIDQAFGGNISNVNTAVSNFNQNHVLDYTSSNMMAGVNPSGRPTPNLSSQPYYPQPPAANQQAMQQMVQQAVGASQGQQSTSVPAYQQASRPPVADQIVAEEAVNSTRQQPQHLPVESFTVMEGPGVKVDIPNRLVLLNLGLIILVALSANEASKYYINRALNSADGQPHYYLAYFLSALVISCIGYWISRRFLA